MFYLSPSNTELCRRFLYLFVSGVIIAWQAKPDLKTINFNEKIFSGKVTQLSIIR